MQTHAGSITKAVYVQRISRCYPSTLSGSRDEPACSQGWNWPEESKTTWVSMEQMTFSVQRWAPLSAGALHFPGRLLWLLFPSCCSFWALTFMGSLIESTLRMESCTFQSLSGLCGTRQLLQCTGVALERLRGNGERVAMAGPGLRESRAGYGVLRSSLLLEQNNPIRGQSEGFKVSLYPICGDWSSVQWATCTHGQGCAAGRAVPCSGPAPAAQPCWPVKVLWSSWSFLTRSPPKCFPLVPGCFPSCPAWVWCRMVSEGSRELDFLCYRAEYCCQHSGRTLSITAPGDAIWSGASSLFLALVLHLSVAICMAWQRNVISFPAVCLCSVKPCLNLCLIWSSCELFWGERLHCCCSAVVLQLQTHAAHVP